MNGIPIIRFELEQMRRTVSIALMEHQALMDEQIQIALDKALAPEAIQEILSTSVQSAVKSVLTEEVRRAFEWTNPGRSALRAAVEKHMATYFGPLEE